MQILKVRLEFASAAAPDSEPDMKELKQA